MELGLLGLELTDLSLEFHVLSLLLRKVVLQLIVDSVTSIESAFFFYSHLPLGLKLQVLTHLGRLVRQDVFKRFLLLSEHLHLALGELDLFVDLADHFLLQVLR